MLDSDALKGRVRTYQEFSVPPGVTLGNARVTQLTRDVGHPDQIDLTLVFDGEMHRLDDGGVEVLKPAHKEEGFVSIRAYGEDAGRLSVFADSRLRQDGYENIGQIRIEVVERQLLEYIRAIGWDQPPTPTSS